MDVLKEYVIKQHLTPDEDKIINHKIRLDLLDKLFNSLKRASIISIITAFIPVWALYSKFDEKLLFSWLAIIILVHTLCLILCNHYRNSNSIDKYIKTWIISLYCAIFMSTLSWGSVGYFLVPNEMLSQTFILFFLIIISAAIALGTSADYPSAIIGILCSMSPYILWQFKQNSISGQDFHAQIGGTLILYTVFLHIVSFVAYRLAKNTIKLGYTTILLSDKLSKSNLQLNNVNQQLKEMNFELEKRVEERTKHIEYQARHDLLTDLPNNLYLITYINDKIKKSILENSSFGVLLLSINRISKLIESHGHNIANKIIIQVAERLKDKLSSTTKSNFLAITRRDVFAIIINSLDEDEAKREASYLLSAFNSPFLIEDKETNLRASIGITLFPNDGNDANKLITNADTALFRAQSSSGTNNIEFHHTHIQQQTAKSIKLENLLYSAKKNGEFILHYQPVIDINNKVVVGTESLIRWKNPELGLISPFDFIPIAEDTGLILEIGEWVIQEACNKLKTLIAHGYNDIIMSINLSGQQLKQLDFTKQTLDLISKSGLDTSNIEFELTETIMLDDKIIPILSELDSVGLKLAIDDFGTKYSTLNYLTKLPIHKLKIDKSFVDKIDSNDSEDNAVIKMIINMAEALKLKVVVEGVEYEYQYNFLKKFRDIFIQGYYFSRPLEISQLITFLDEKNYLTKI